MTILWASLGLKAQEVLKTQMFDFKYVEFPTANKPLLMKPILNIEVLDARTDSFCSGFLRGGKAIALKDGLQQEFKQIFTSASTKSEDGFSLLIVIKELWFYDNGVGKTNNVDDIDVSNSGLLFRTDIYLKHGQEYIPLLKIDTIYIEKRPIEKSINNLFDQCFSYFFEKIEHCPIEAAFQSAKRVRTKPEIDSFYKQVNNFKYHKSLHFSNQCIFNSADDFKNGIYENVSIRSFKDKKGTFFYSTNSSGTETPIHSFAIWSHDTLLVKTNNFYSPVYIHNNRLYTLTVKPFKPVHQSISIPLPASQFGLLYVPLPINWTTDNDFGINYAMLDMVTGNVY